MWTRSIDEVTKILGDRRRRAIFYCLGEHDVATVDGSAAHLATEETGTPAGEGFVDQRERIEPELVQDALEKLAGSYFIEYDPGSDAVGYADSPEHLQLFPGFLARLERPTREWRSTIRSL